MTSGSRSRSPALASDPSPEAGAQEAAALSASGADEARRANAIVRLGRWLPRLSGLVRFAYRTAALSAVCAVVLWWALAGDLVLALGGVSWLLGAALLGLLLLPAGAAWVLGLTLHDVLTLPERLRQGASSAAATSREALAGTAEPGGRITGLIRAVWAARGFVLESKGAWAKAATAARVVRLARLPFVLGTLGLFALNIPVILGGIVALALLLL